MAAVSAKVQHVTLGQQGEQLYLCLQISAWQNPAVEYHLHMAKLPASGDASSFYQLDIACHWRKDVLRCSLPLLLWNQPARLLSCLSAKTCCCCHTRLPLIEACVLLQQVQHKLAQRGCILCLRK